MQTCKRWADIERATVAYGYGITSTPLQIGVPMLL